MQGLLFAATEESSVDRLDPKEAPPGYFAVRKSDVKSEALGNICRACDWRTQCDGSQHRCMPYTIVTADGRELTRKDGCSVVFKRRAA